MPHDAYVRLVGGETEGIRARAGDRLIEVDDASDFCRVVWDDFRAPVAWLKDVSRDLETEVLWLVMQKQTDAFAFQRWVRGDLKRRLSYGVEGQERTWEEVEGAPEPWEAEVLFSAKRLDQKLRVLQIIDVPDRDGQAAALRRIWAERRIEVGSSEPSVSPASAGPAVARYYRLLGWE